jgi:hypothetical protein
MQAHWRAYAPQILNDGGLVPVDSIFQDSPVVTALRCEGWAFDYAARKRGS